MCCNVWPQIYERIRQPEHPAQYCVVEMMKKISLPIFEVSLFVILFVLGCSSDDSNVDDHNEGIDENSDYTLKKVPVASGLIQPWGMVFLNESELLVTEKSGGVRHVVLGSDQNTEIYKVDAAAEQGQGGLLDVALHPDFELNGKVYFTYTKENAGEFTTALGQAVYADKQITDFRELFEADAYTSSGVHFGSRMVFDEAGYLYFSVGDRGSREEAQNASNHIGCVIRLHDDGSVPADNPFVNDPDYRDEIWSYGHRNIQGLALHPETGEIWSHEHGPQGGDEVNVLHKGENYGWPEVSYGEEYGGGTIGDTARDGFVDPLHVWTPSIAPCGMAFLHGESYAGLNNAIAIGALAGQHLNITLFSGESLSREIRFFEGEGRVRNTAVSPSGILYIADESSGEIYRIDVIVE